MLQKLILNPAGVAVTRVNPPFGDLPDGWLYAPDDGRSLGVPPPPPPAIRKISLAAFLARITAVEYAGMMTNPNLGYALACQTAENDSSVNLDSERLKPLLLFAVREGILSPERVIELQRDGTPEEV
jgi:hypothetical protein